MDAGISLSNVLTFLVIIFHNSADSEVRIQGCSEGTKGQSCELICNTPEISYTVAFRKNSSDRPVGSCTAKSKCDSAFGYKLHQWSNSSAYTSLEIPSLNYVTDEDTWTCDYGVAPSSNNVSIIVRTIPTNVTAVLQPNSESPEIVKALGNCVYPNDVKVEFVYKDVENDRGNVKREIPTEYSSGVPGCASHEYAVVGSLNLSEIALSVLSGKRIDFKIRITVAGLSSYQESSWMCYGDCGGTISSDPPCPLKCKIGIVVGVVMLVLLAVVIGICCYRISRGKKNVPNLRSDETK